ncbi:hypothetical protein BpHYR1_015403, partial [Brachionus plicatilis]
KQCEKKLYLHYLNDNFKVNVYESVNGHTHSGKTLEDLKFSMVADFLINFGDDMDYDEWIDTIDGWYKGYKDINYSPSHNNALVATNKIILFPTFAELKIKENGVFFAYKNQ